MAILQTISTTAPSSWDKSEIKKENKKLVKQIAELQRILYADSTKSILLILQGVDASGKDGAIRRIFSTVNPLGCRVYAFKAPTEKEAARDFLWRVHNVVPPKGMIHIFNRSHYEDILVPQVNGDLSENEIHNRYKHINNFEALLTSNKTKILKCYLHVSKEEQLERLTERIENPTKHWKHKDGDWKSRKLWDDYMKTYEGIFEHCNAIPWHIIPSDKNWVKVNYISKLLIKTMEEMQLKWPGLETDTFTNNPSS